MSKMLKQGGRLLTVFVAGSLADWLHEQGGRLLSRCVEVLYVYSTSLTQVLISLRERASKELDFVKLLLHSRRFALLLRRLF